jgi:hypothetical protein
MLASRYEAILRRSKTQGASRRRRQSTQGRSCKDLLHVGAHHQALYLKWRRETGDLEPRPIAGRPCVKGAAQGTAPLGTAISRQNSSPCSGETLLGERPQRRTNGALHQRVSALSAWLLVTPLARLVAIPLEGS